MGGVSWTIESSPVAFGEAAGLTFDLKGLRDKVGLDRGEGEDLGGVILRSELGSLGVKERLLGSFALANDSSEDPSLLKALASP